MMKGSGCSKQSPGLKNDEETLQILDFEPSRLLVPRLTSSVLTFGNFFGQNFRQL